MFELILAVNTVVLATVSICCLLCIFSLTSKIKKSKEHQIREEFISALVHSLRAPLSVIHGTSDLIIERFSSLTKEKIVSLSKEIKKSTEDLLDLVSDLLEVSKIETGRYVPQRGKHDFIKLVKGQADFYRILAQRKLLYLKVDISEPSMFFSFDKDGMERVFGNFISNAIKYTKSGGITIKVYKDEQNKSAVTAISDTGIGIPESERKHLFKKFERIVNADSEKEQGTGLGLVIAKEIIEAHKGKIWFESEPKKGSSFYFSLPM